jgi:hypothetical protein
MKKKVGHFKKLNVKMPPLISVSFLKCFAFREGEILFDNVPLIYINKVGNCLTSSQGVN